MTFTQEEITAIANLPSNAYKFKAHIDNLIALYRWCREQWTTQAIKTLTAENNLDLRRKEDRAKFGWYAAQELAKALPPAPQVEAKAVKVLCQAIALLPPVPTTNGLENAPAYRVMGSPIYADELRRNYEQLVKKWHPDINKSLEAVGRFQLVTELYRTLRDKWFEKYSPLIPGDRLGKDNLNLAMDQKFAWSPESFWQ
jgi:hypothetical protein